MDEEHAPDTVGRRIGRVARQRGVKAKDLESVSGLDRGSIAKLLRGDRESTSLEAGLRIARFLGVDPYSLLPEHAGGQPEARALAQSESLPQDERVRKLEADFRELRAGLARLEASLQPGAATPSRRRKAARNG